jgi:hypothetical protein
MRWLFLLFFSASACPARAGGDSTLISALLRDIAARQQLQTHFFSVGSFPGLRIHASRPSVQRADNNIFFTGLLGLGLSRVRSDLRGPDSLLCDSVLRAIPESYPRYRNRSGRMTFNFWPSDPPRIFPGDPLLHVLSRSHALADDLDDTAILLDTMDGVPDSTLRQVKTLMEAHANGTSRFLHNYYRRYKKVPAYSTWFGRHMPVDFDFAVLCNVLYWVCRYHLPFDRRDSATAGMLADMVRRGLLTSDPAYLSPHYGRTPVLFYHISRLVGTFSVPGLDSLKPLLVAQIKAALGHTNAYLDRVLLSTSLLRLGVPATAIPLIPLGSIDEDDRSFVFFIGTFSDYFRNPFRRLFLHNRLIRYEFQCVAYDRFLLLEYLLLRRQSLA